MPQEGTSTPMPEGPHHGTFMAEPPQAQHFARASGAIGEDAKLTPVQRFVMGRDDASFHAFAGAVGGFMSGIVTCPLDVIKTKLQAQGGLRSAQAAGSSATSAVLYNGMLGTGRLILREDGVRGLYRGLGPIILGYIPTWAVWFTVYGKSKGYLADHTSMLMSHSGVSHANSRQIASSRPISGPRS
jgi:solute carrier family 25 folate transporter 32